MWKAYIVTAKTNQQTFTASLKKLLPGITVRNTTVFSPGEAAKADLVFVDEETVEKNCKEITSLKSRNGFIPFILLAPENRSPQNELPECIDDIILPSFTPFLWKKRLNTYLRFKKEEETSLLNQEEEYKTLFQENHSIMLLIDPATGQIVDANRAACNFYGYTHDELIKKKITDINKASEEQVKKNMENARANKQNFFVFEHRLADGSIKTVEVYSGQVNYKGGKRLYSIIHDITQRKEIEQQLAESEENYRKIIEDAPDIIILVDQKGIIKYINRRIADYGDYKKEDFVGKPVTRFVPRKDHQKVREAIRRVFKQKQRNVSFFSTSITLKTGEKIPILTKGILLHFDNMPLNMTIIRDIRPVKEVENKLKEANETLQNIFDNNSVAIYIQNRKGTFIEVNKAAAKLYGFSDKNSLIGKTPADVAAEGKNDIDKIKKFVSLAFENKPQQFEFWGKRKNGTVFPKLVTIEKGNYFGADVVFAFSIDISEQKKMEDALRESEEKFNSIFNSSPYPAHLVNKNFEVVLANQTLLKLKGYQLKDVLGKKCHKVFQEKNEICEKCAVKQVFESGKPASNEAKLTLHNGETRYFNTMAYPVLGKDNTIKYVVESTIDITEKKQIDEKLKQSEDRYRSLFHFIKDCVAVYEVTDQGNIIFKDFNRSAEKLEHIKRKDIINKKLQEVFPGAESFGLVEAIKKVYRTGKPMGLPVKFYQDNRIAGWRENYIYKLPSGEVVALYNDITKQKQAEEKLVESENKYRTLAEASSDLILSFDITGKLTYLSPAVKKITGYSADEVLGKNFWDFIAPEYVESTIEKFKLGINGADIPLYEIDLLHKSGKRIPVELNVTSLYDSKGKPTGRIAIVRDITERREAEKALKESELRLKKFSKITKEGIVIHNKAITIDANQAFLDMTGYSLDEIVGKNIIELLVKPEYRKLTYESVKNEYSAPYDIEAVKKDGTTLFVELTGIDFIDSNGKKARAVVVKDIKWRKQMENSLRESENKYRTLAEGSIDLIVTYDLNGNITYANEVAKVIFGYSQEEVIGTKFTDYISPETVHLAIDAFNKGKQGGSVQLYELELIHKSGRKIPIEVNPNTLYDANGKIIGRLSVVRDISVRKEAEKELLLRDKALNAAANAIIITRADGVIEWINEAFTKLSGYSKKEAIGKYTGDLVNSGKQNKAFFDNVNKTLHSGHVWKGEITDKRKDGTLYVVEEVITPVTNQNGDVEHLIGIMTDITERKAAEQELRAAKEAAEESNRLKSAFLANMNHEIRTPMNAIMGFSELMLEAATDKEKDNYARIVNNSAGQLLHLIDDVIFLSRLQSEKLPVKKNIFYPAELLKEILLMFDIPEMNKNLKIKLQIPGEKEKTAIRGDVYKIRQVMTNFTSNAIKYTKQGHVKLGFEIHDKKILFFVEDTGIGIPKEEQERIFEAFYRSSSAIRSAIRGTGLGLNIAKELVNLMEGNIGVSSQPGKGSRFYFSLPYEPVKITAKEMSPQKPETKKWKELNILIAEDDDTNYLYLEVLLKDKVKRIDRAQTGQEAVEMAQKNNYDMIFMDLKMPVMSGDQATRKIKKLFPRLPVLATTAYAMQEEKDRALKAGCDEYLSKPIKKTEIMALIDKYALKKE